jgi:hypothetical protein
MNIMNFSRDASAPYLFYHFDSDLISYRLRRLSDAISSTERSAAFAQLPNGEECAG